MMLIVSVLLDSGETVQFDYTSGPQTSDEERIRTAGQCEQESSLLVAQSKDDCWTDYIHGTAFLSLLRHLLLLLDGGVEDLSCSLVRFGRNATGAVRAVRAPGARLPRPAGLAGQLVPGRPRGRAPGRPRSLCSAQVEPTPMTTQPPREGQREAPPFASSSTFHGRMAECTLRRFARISCKRIALVDNREPRLGSRHTDHRFLEGTFHGRQ
jgi:hypothetical protein